ncbi:O-antigen ligase family protein [Weissella confusa]|uniref:O-antigen ligase family protein n=1 Tax=Weissella confusa TaxID=1583 RepID=UPI001C6FB60E|nr:O-antigen ligase family protein [Weissella confusa]QYU58643.1 O-antigen ligase family protein [Weissella confusa]
MRKIINSVQEVLIRHKFLYGKLVDISVFLFAVFGTLRFVPSLPINAGWINDKAGLLIVLLTFPFVNWKRNKYILSLLGILLIITGISIMGGGYKFDLQLSWEQVFRWGSFYLIAIGTVEHYKDNLERFVEIWFVSLLLVLGGLSIFYASEINLNMQTLLEGMIGNVRMSRISIGFMNVNNLGGFAATLIVISMFNLLSRTSNFKISSGIAIAFGLVLLINSGARTSFIAIIATVLSGSLVFFKKDIRIKLWLLITGLYILVTGFLTSLLFLGDRSSAIFKSLDGFLSLRLFFGNASIEWVREHSMWALFFGSGIQKVQKIAEAVYEGRGVISIDMSVAFYAVSFGIVGLIVVYSFWQYGLVKIGLTGNVIAMMTGVYVSTYMISEAVLFGVNGLFGALWTVFFLMLLRNASERSQNSNSVTSRVARYKN